MTVEDRESLQGDAPSARRDDRDLVRRALILARRAIAQVLGRIERYLVRLERRIDDPDR